MPALLEPLGQEKLTGLLLGLWGVGSLLTALLVARAGAASDPPRRLSVLLVAWGAAHAALALATGPVSLGVLLLIAGASISPVMVYANGMLDDLAPAGTLAEAFTWTTTGLTAGIASGAALAGVLVKGLALDGVRRARGRRHPGRRDRAHHGPRGAASGRRGRRERALYRLLYTLVLRADPARDRPRPRRRAACGWRYRLGLLRRCSGPPIRRCGVHAFGPRLPGPLGLAAGFDKDAEGFARSPRSASASSRSAR